MQPEEPSASPPGRPGAPDEPTAGSASGDHRVVAPPEAEPLDAEQLDPLPDLWDAEARLDLEAVVLPATGLAELHALLGHTPERLRAALLTASAERGALAGPLADATLIGTVAAVGRSRRPGTGRPDQRVAVAAPAAAVPAWLRDISGWDGHGRVVPATGHAIVAARHPVVAVPAGLGPLEAATLAELADVPPNVAALTPRDGHVVVLDATSVAGAVAALAAGAAGARRVVALVGSLQEARLARALGVDEPVVGPPASVATTALLDQALGGHEADLVVVAGHPGNGPDGDAGGQAPRLTHNGVVLLLDPADAAGLVRHARAVGSQARIRVDRAQHPGQGHVVFDLLGGHPHLGALLRWRVGTGPAPRATLPEEP